MADKRLKALLRSSQIEDVLGNYGFTRSDVVPQVALAAAAVLLDSNGAIQGMDAQGNVVALAPTWGGTQNFAAISATGDIDSVGGAVNAYAYSYFSQGLGVAGLLQAYDFDASSSMTFPAAVSGYDLPGSAASGYLFVDGSGFVKRA